MQYLKMPQNKFWGWVIASTLVGLAIGLTIMFVSGASATNRIAALQAQIANSSTDSSAAAAAAEARAVAAEASAAALSDQVAQLTADLAAQGAGTTPAEPSTPATPTLVIVSRTITPGTVDASHTITMTAKVKGSPSKVTMRIYNASKSYDKTFTLHKVSTSGGTQTWRATAKAPATPGTYKYYSTATKGSVKVTMPGHAPSTLKVQ